MRSSGRRDTVQRVNRPGTEVSAGVKPGDGRVECGGRAEMSPLEGLKWQGGQLGSTVFGIQIEKRMRLLRMRSKVRACAPVGGSRSC